MGAKRYFLETFGCQMNVLDSELVAGQLRELGYGPTDERREADLILYNTCAVREHAEHKVWSRLGEVARLKRRRPDLLVGVLGCMAQEWQAKILKKAPSVDLVLGTREVGSVAAAVRRLERDRAPVVKADLTRPVSVERDIAVRGQPYSAYVTVMYGCDFGCTYCIVPRTRGVEQSRPIEEIRREVERLCSDGVREVTLLGQTVDSYGKTLPGRPNLGDLLEAIHEVDGLWRIRFITSHPQLMREPILRRMAELEKVCEYLHIPAQSGSDRMLQAMRRGYTADRYREIVATAREICPDVAIASDFIVGFPGETDADFEESLAMAEELRFSQAYVFKYSPRPGTGAADLLDDVPDAVKRKRNQRLLKAQERVQAELNAARVGTRMEVLCEGTSKQNERSLAGRNRQNRIVCFEGDAEALTGQLLTVEITDATPFTLYGCLPGQPPLHARRPSQGADAGSASPPPLSPPPPPPPPTAPERPRLQPLPMVS